MFYGYPANPETACYAVWTIWALSWFLAAGWSDRAQTRPSLVEQLPYRVVTTGGFVLLFVFYARNYVGPLRLWVLPDAIGWAMVAMCAGAFLFAWWARIHLGRLWSGWVTKTEGHTIVDTGPYGIVRHPIYTGLITAAFALMIVKGTVLAIAGAFFIALGFWIKARLEERFLGEQLGAEAYDDYRKNVPMLIPGGPR